MRGRAASPGTCHSLGCASGAAKAAGAGLGVRTAAAGAGSGRRTARPGADVVSGSASPCAGRAGAAVAAPALRRSTPSAAAARGERPGGVPGGVRGGRPSADKVSWRANRTVPVVDSVSSPRVERAEGRCSSGGGAVAGPGCGGGGARFGESLRGDRGWGPIGTGGGSCGMTASRWGAARSTMSRADSARSGAAGLGTGNARSAIGATVATHPMRRGAWAAPAGAAVERSSRRSR